MSSNVPIGSTNPGSLTAPTPQNTPLNQAPIALGLSRPTVPDISEDNEGEASSANDKDDADANDNDGTAGIEEGMLNLMVQGKLAGLLGRSSGYVESLPDDVKANVEALKGVQEKQNELHNKYKKECLELEKKYLQLTKPLYERRNAIVTGKAGPTPEEIKAGEAVSAKEDEDYTPLPSDLTPSSTGIPEFWLTALRNHVGLNEIITDRDAEALKSLIDIRLEYLDDANNGAEVKDGEEGKPGFKLIFEFGKNDFFEDEILEKTYLYQEEVGYSGDFVYDRAIGTEIRWKEDKDLTKEFEIKKQRNRNNNRTRLVRKARPAESFFNFFSPPVPPSDEGIENGDYEDEELADIEEKLEIDYQIGEDMKEKIIPHAIDYFTGKALEYEGFGSEDEDEEDDFEDIDEEDELEGSEDDSEEEAPAARRKAAPKGRGGNNKNVNPDDCKQQ